MGAEQLAANLTEVTKRPWTVKEAKELIDQHKAAYPDYWRFKEDTWNSYTNSRHGLQISGDWWLGPDNPNKLSTLNCPVQGLGAAVLREAVVRCVRAGLHVISPLHDAIYILHRTDEEKALLLKLMHDAAIDVQQEMYGRAFIIRIDAKTVKSNEWYVEGKGKEMFEKFKNIITGTKVS